MLERHTFKALIETIVAMEHGIQELEHALKCHFDSNWMTAAPEHLIHTIANSFFGRDTSLLEDCQAETIEELLYHFIYMEDCGNLSEHCKSKLVIVDEGKSTEHCVPCTSLDELYNVIQIYLNSPTCDFTFNYCHSYRLDEEVK